MNDQTDASLDDHSSPPAKIDSADNIRGNGTDMTSEENNINEQPEAARKDQGIVRLIKSIVENPERGRTIDETVVQLRYFNAFNYSMLAGEGKDVNLTVGITSANRGEGKTLVACNLAVSLAMGFQKKTVLVDLNLIRPRIHEIFGVKMTPGLVDAFNDGAITVSPTAIEHLFVLSSGIAPLYYGTGAPDSRGPDGTPGGSPKPFLGLNHLSEFRNVIYSLKQEFDFIIADIPTIGTDEIPVLFTNQLNGLLVVVNAGRTKQEDINSMFQKINAQQVLGFVFNRFS